MALLQAKKSTAPRILVAGGPETGAARWLTGFGAPDPFGVAMTSAGEVHLFVSHLEAARAAKAAKPGVQLHVIDGTLSAALVEWARSRQLRKVVAGPALPLGVARAFEEASIAVSLLSPQDEPLPGRLVKTEEELRYIRLAQHAAAAAVARARVILREATVSSPSGQLRWQGRTLTSERLREEMENVIRSRGCASDDGLIAAGGRQAACPHEAGHGPLCAGTAIILDVFPRHQASGYWGDLTRTLMKGRPRNPRILAMYRAVLATQRRVFEALRPGVTGAAMHQLALDSLAAAGFPLDTTPGHERGMFHGLGHGVGLDIHEEPRLSLRGPVLAEGNVITVEPGVYDPAVGGIRIEDTVVVRPDGPQFLAPCSRALFIP